MDRTLFDERRRDTVARRGARVAQAVRVGVTEDVIVTSLAMTLAQYRQTFRDV